MSKKYFALKLIPPRPTFAQDMSDEEFDRSLAEAIDEIYDASTEKVAA